ncbi:MAG: hypothetical protein RJB30_55 [Actinomycetota bacterium]
MALWGGRFGESTADVVFALSKSVQFDWRLAPYDLAGSRAHLSVLESAGLIDLDSAAKIRKALEELQSEVASGEFQPIESDEDVHSALERGLTAKLGELGGAIRAGRSRNDQVATDLRLYLIDHMLEIADLLIGLGQAFNAKGMEYVDAIAPGFTHLQHAQPVSFGQELSKHSIAIDRDLSRIFDWLSRTNQSPLGSGALSGSSLPIAPEETAKLLGFDAPVLNSIDGVSDRDFAAEALFILALVGVHLSRIGEEWTIWSTSEFGWAKLDDAFATGSSIMPQKKNPDIAELARGKAGPLIGNLTALLTTLKGLPFAYNRDLQEDKLSVFNSVENLLVLLPAVTGMVSSTTFDRARMRNSAPEGFSLATEIADYLVRKGVAFSIAHEAAGRCVQICEGRGAKLEDLTDAELIKVHPELDGEVRNYLDLDGAVAARSTINGTAPKSVASAIELISSRYLSHGKWVADGRARFSGMIVQ